MGKRWLFAALEQAGDARLDLTFQRRPFFLFPGGDYPVSHWGDRVNERSGHPGQAQGLKDLGAAAGFDFNMAAPLSDTMDSHRLYLWAYQLSELKGEALAQAVGIQYFTKAQALADRTMLCKCVAEVGLDPAAARAYLDSQEGYAEVNASVASLHRAGVHSIPVFIIKADSTGTGEPFEEIVHGSADVARFTQVFQELSKWAEKSTHKC